MPSVAERVQKGGGALVGNMQASGTLEEPGGKRRSRSSDLPPGAKYYLWRAASDLPLHRVGERLSAGHLQPRSSRDRYRILQLSQRDGKLPLIDSSLFLPAPSNSDNPSDRRRSVNSRRETFPLPSHKANGEGLSARTDAVAYRPKQPSRLGRRSLSDWVAMQHHGRNSRRQVPETVARERAASSDGVIFPVDGFSRGKQQLFQLQSTTRNCSSHQPAARRPSRNGRVTRHVTRCYGDVSPPPSPHYEGLRIGY